MKKNLGWITMAAVIASMPAVKAQAGEGEVPFKACKKVALVKNDKERDELEKRGCRAAVEHSAPGIGDSVKNSVTYASIGAMLHDVAEKQYLPDLDKKIAYWEETKKCFLNPSSSADCQKRTDKIKSEYGNFVGTLRNALALTNLSKKDGSFEPASELKGFSTEKLPFIPNAFPDAVTGSMQSNELKVAKAAAESAKGSEDGIEQVAKAQYVSTLSDGIQKNGLYLVAYLPKPSSAGANGTAEWSNSEWSKTIDRLISDAKNEKKVTQDAIAKGTVSFPAFGTRDLVPSWNKNERDLMYYSTLSPEMEKHLEKNPQDCGLAIAATKWMQKLEYQKMGESMAAFLVGGAGGAKALTMDKYANLGRLGKLGKGLASGAAIGGGWVGGVMTYNDYQKTQDNADTSFRQLAKIGVEKGKEVDVADPKKYAEAQEAADKWVSHTLMAQGGFLAGGVVIGGGAKLAKALVSKGKDVKKALGRFIMSTRNEKAVDLLAKGEGLPAEYRANLAANMQDPEVQHAIRLNKEVRSDLAEMEKSKVLNDKEIGEVEDLLHSKQGDVAKRLETEGKCKGETCYVMAAEEEGKALREAKNSCTAKGAK